MMGEDRGFSVISDNKKEQLRHKRTLLYLSIIYPEELCFFLFAIAAVLSAFLSI